MYIADLYKDISGLEDTAEAGKKLGKEFSRKVNSICCPVREIAEELYSDKELCGSFGKVCALWVYILHEMSHRPYMTDGRNEYSVRTGNLLWNDEAFRNYMEEKVSEEERKTVLEGILTGGIRLKKQKEASLEQVLVVYMAGEHRTLQQTFSGIIFQFLNLKIPKFSNFMKGGWEKCPMV